MIVVDTSALMAIILKEPLAEQCTVVLETSQTLAISATTFAEALIVSARRNIKIPMETLLNNLAIEIIAVTAARARLVSAAYDQWGRGVHPAALNLGDCFAYALAKERDCPLLFIGNDFTKTDVKRAL